MNYKVTLKISTILAFVLFCLVTNDNITYASFDISTVCTQTRSIFGKVFCPTAQRDSGGFFDGGVTLGGWRAVNLNNDPITRGRLTVFSSKSHCGDPSFGGDTFLYISINGGSKYSYSICSGANSINYIEDGGLMRIITPLEVSYGDVVYFTLGTTKWINDQNGCFKKKGAYCEVIGVMPGWVASDLSAKPQMSAFFNNNKEFDGKKIYELGSVTYGDFDLDANWGGADYYDLNDQDLTLALTEIEEPPPACNPDSDVLMYTNPNPALVAGNISINAVNNGYAGSSQLSFTGISDKPCSGTPSSPNLRVSYGITNCTVNKDSGTYTWTIHYQLFNKTGAGKSNTCSKSMEYQIIERPGYLITSGGDTYIKDGFNMPSYYFYAKPLCEVALNKAYCMSENLFAYKSFVFQGVIPCNNCSTNKYSKTNYDDLNDNYLNFDQLKKSILKRASAYDIKNYAAPVFTTTNPLTTRIFDISGSYSIPAGKKCNNSDIFFVNGDLTIAPDFTIVNYPNDSTKMLGCLFVVNGNLIIQGGSPQKGINKYDIVQGFFVLTANDSKLIIDEDGNDLIKIIGGVVINNQTQDQLARKGKRVGGFAPPAEYLIYEGSRYISIFGNLLVDDGLSYNIYELPFINTFTQ